MVSCDVQMEYIDIYLVFIVAWGHWNYLKMACNSKKMLVMGQKGVIFGTCE